MTEERRQVIVDASWDSAIEKIDFLHDHAGFCGASFVQRADYITIPFSASTLGPRNGAAALDMVTAAIHVTTGDVVMDFRSGVSFFDPELLVQRTAGLRCPIQRDDLAYDSAGAPTAVVEEDDDVLPWVLVAAFAAVGVLAAAGTYKAGKKHGLEEGLIEAANKKSNELNPVEPQA